MKRSIVLPLLLALAACSDDPAELIERARGEYAEQDFLAARNDLAAAQRAEPGNRDALVLLARAQLRLADGEGAQASIDQLKALGMKGPELVRMEAEALLCRNQPQQAIDLLGNDNAADAWRIRAAARIKLGDSAGALAAFEAGMAAGGGYLITLDFGQYLLANGDVAGAAVQAQRLARYDADSLASLMLNAEVANRQGRAEAAHQAWARAAKLYPKRIEPLLADARAYDAQGKVEQAAKLVERAAELEPDNPDVFDLQVQLAGEMGEWDKVRTMLAPKEGELSPISAKGLSYAEALLRLGHPEQARAWFERAMLLSPNNPYSRLMAAEAQLATGDAAAAYRTIKPLADSLLAGPRELELAERAAREAGDPAAPALKARLQSAQLKQNQTLNQQGHAALARNDWNAAIAAFSQLAQQGEDAEVFKRLAFALSNVGRHDEAIGYADRALKLDPENPDMLHIAGLTRLNAGRDRPTVLRLLKAAADKDPNSVQFRGDLARAQARG
ncbi:tetratricopeptide repeat protein [Novosphingobium sp.]|uniref:tetratricopeptide repeat protein n=1 Tax=Novosphingobium sp. TaxID=1874826 RepID=UPI0025FC994B|nr:tetratricopeptide repeat protein [Novosphingobium sp.]MCC6925653.1 tetratricopeptide repeat protein [Novosphingobium sp.]